MWLYIQPNDAIFLKDGRAFDAGGNLYAGNLFPPYPPTCYGLIRTLLVHLVSPQIDYHDFFLHVPEKYHELLGNKNKMGELSIKGAFIGEQYDEGITVYIKSPADLFYKKNDDNDDIEWFLLQPEENSILMDFSNIDIPFHELSIPTDLEPAAHFIDQDNGLETYLMGKTTNSFLMKNTLIESCWETEQSTIIERVQDTLIAKDHQLAFPNYTRMNENFGLLVQLDDNLAEHFQTTHIVRLGGEGRVCHMSQQSIKSICDPQKLIQRIQDSNGRFKVILVTPGYFENNGYYPDFLTLCSNNNDHQKMLKGEWIISDLKKQVRLVSMTANRAERIGGWDLAKGEPKTMVKAVPAGSVYFFEIIHFNKNEDQNWITQLVQTSLPGTLPGDVTYCKQGFNTFIIGGWDYV